MSSSTSTPVVNLYTQGGGTASSGQFPTNPIIKTTSPTTSDTLGPFGTYPIGQNWINSTTGSIYELAGYTALNGVISATWVVLGGSTSVLDQLTGNSGTASPVGSSIAVTGSGVVSTTASGSTVAISVTPGSTLISTVTGDTGGAVSPSSGNLNLNGTANQITVTGTANTETLSIPSNFIAPGAITASTTLTASVGNVTVANGNVIFGTSGNKIVSSNVATTTTAGANSFGSVTLASGTATVNTTAVTASSLIVIWRQSVGATGANPLGKIASGTIIGGTSFVINSYTTANATTIATTDVSVIGWMIIN